VAGRPGLRLGNTFFVDRFMSCRPAMECFLQLVVRRCRAEAFRSHWARCDRSRRTTDQAGCLLTHTHFH